MEQLAVIASILRRNKIEVTQSQLAQLSCFYDLVIAYNKKFNITAITDLDEFACKHFADSLLGYDYYQPNSTICDIGTGGGFPGIPLKILRPDLKMTLVDSLQKRVNFLNIVVRELGLIDTVAIHSRAQELPQNSVPRETFDYVISRAVAQLNILCELCLPFAKVGGEMIAYKSQNTQNELTIAQNAIDLLGGKLQSISEFDLISSTDEHLTRNLIHIKKLSNTPTKYPRPKNKITTQPL